MFRALQLVAVLLSIASAAAADEGVARPSQVGYRRIDLKFKTAAGEERRRRLDLWYPTDEKESPYDYRGQKGFVAKDASVAKGQHPLLVFSHGYLGGSDQSIFLTETCARQGYIVASMNHADGLLNVFAKKQDPPEFAQFAKWTDEKYRDRQEDVVALLDQFVYWNKTDGALFQDHVDENRIGGIGHSLGGYTILGLAGGWKTWQEPRLKTAVLLSPYSLPYDVNGQLDKVTIPVMIQGGTLDFGIRPFLPPVYKKLAGPKAYLELKNETHFGWTNLIGLGKTTTETVSAGNAELIVRYTVAFLDQHLRGLDQSKVLGAKELRLEVLKIDGK